ncbi:hypothetical protein E2C01_002450 [Portunus trituberculatus]|uniref:Uncharacterized protein n=1 Tax=Portunus trituberculatus TaxID=210409 RepID=A0A5B7CLY7_PORTR|nr:hypothetical protein [Portunus trituberculatus]
MKATRSYHRHNYHYTATTTTTTTVLPNDIQKGVKNLWLLFTLLLQCLLGLAYQDGGVPGMNTGDHGDAQSGGKDRRGEIIAKGSGSHLA